MMRRWMITVAAAGTALTAAAPASAQYYQGQRGYGYGYNQYGQARALKVRIDGIERQIDRLRYQRQISRDEANGLRREANRVEERLMRASRYGLNGWEARDIEQRIAYLERRVVHEVRDGRGHGWNNGYDRYRDHGYRDRDRDGRNDRYEDDQGERHDD